MRDLLILHQGAIGDFVLSLSVIQPLRAELRPDRVIAVASAPSARLAAGADAVSDGSVLRVAADPRVGRGTQVIAHVQHGGRPLPMQNSSTGAGTSAIDQWCSPDSVGLHTLFREDGDISSSLQELLATSDWVVSFLGSRSDALHARLVEHARGKVISIDPRPTVETMTRRIHITTQWAEAIHEQGMETGNPEPARIRVVHEPAASKRANAPILIHPGAGGLAKCWPAERFADLANRLAPREVQWMLGPAEWEREPDRFAPIRRRIAERREALHMEEDLAPAAQAMVQAACYVGNDAGPTHIAAAIGLPTTVLFGPTDPAVWRPLGQNVKVIAPPVPGEINALSVDQVFRELS